MENEYEFCYTQSIPAADSHRLHRIDALRSRCTDSGVIMSVSPDFNPRRASDSEPPGDGLNSITETGQRRAISVLAAFVTCWVVVTTTLVVGGDFWAKVTGHPYQIPQFLIDSFVTVVNVAVGATAGGIGIGVAAAAWKAIERKNRDRDDEE